MMQGIRQTGEGGMEFKPQRSRKTGRAILIISSAFIVFNIWVFVFAGISAGLAMSGASILLLFFIIFETGRFGWSYIVGEDGIRIKRTFKKYFIARENIDSVKETSLEGIGKIVAGIKNGKSGKSASGQNTTGGIPLQIELGRLIGHSSIPVNISESKPGSRSKRSTGRKDPAREQFLLLTKKDGKQYILTPSDINGFLQACRQMLRGGQ